MPNFRQPRLLTPLRRSSMRSTLVSWSRFFLASCCCGYIAFASASREASAERRGAEAHNGIAVVIGGALRFDNDEIWSRIVQLAGGKGARFAVFATSSANPNKTADDIVNALNQRGAVAEHIPVSAFLKVPGVRDAVRDPALIAKVRTSNGIFFSGGAQQRIVDALYEKDGASTPMLDAIWDVYQRGGVVAGTSAGAAIMSTTMFSEPPENLTILKNGLKPGHDIGRGLGFVGKDLFVDQHFLKCGRLGRLLPMMLQTGYKLGLGVDENTAAIVRKEEIEVIGHSGVLLVDLMDARSDKAVSAFNLANARISYLERGDRYQLSTRTTTPSREKLAGKKISPADATYSPYFTDERFYADVLGDAVIANLLANFIDNRQKEVVGLAFAHRTGKDVKVDLGFEFRFRKMEDSLGYLSSASGGEAYTVTNIYLDVRPIRMAVPLYREYRATTTPR